MFRLLGFIRRIFIRHNDCNFIYSSIQLPEPLKEDEEGFYLNDFINNHNHTSRDLLIERNLRLVVFIAKKFENDKTPLEDLISIGSMGLIKGVESFKLDKNIKLATYASRCIENEILMYLRKTKKEKSEVSLDETLNVDSDGNELYLSDVLGTSDTFLYDSVLEEERLKLMYEAVSRLKPRERRIITLRYGLYKTKSMTQKEVAEFLGISQSYISRLEKKIIDKLYDELSKTLAM